MAQWLGLWSAVAAVFGVVALGGLLRRFDWLTAAADASLLKLVVRVFVPCLIVRSVVGNPALDRAENVWLPPMVGFGTVAVSFAVCAAAAYALGPRIGLRSPAARRTFAVAAGLHNYGYLPIPLAEALYPAAAGEPSAVLGVLFVNNVGVDLAMWTLGVALIGGGLGLAGLRRVVNGPSVAVVAALVLHVAGGDAWLPGFVTSAVGWLGACAVPMALLLIGATMVDALGKLRADGGEAGPGVGRMAAAACVARLGVLPLLFVGLASALPAVGGGVELQRVALLHAAMPAAVFPIVLARHYGGDPATATVVALSTSVVSLLTMPLWLAAGAAWVGG
ncbi:MAG: AEC family transporter [Planctomycetota bacterium]